MAIKHITRDEIDQILEQAGKDFVGVTFKKKSTGEIRTIGGLLHCAKYSQGNIPTYAHKEDIVGIWERKSMAYKAFSKDMLLSMRVNGDVYKIKKEA